MNFSDQPTGHVQEVSRFFDKQPGGSGDVANAESLFEDDRFETTRGGGCGARQPGKAATHDYQISSLHVYSPGVLEVRIAGLLHADTQRSVCGSPSNSRS
jgi:hypothetical protein